MLLKYILFVDEELVQHYAFYVTVWKCLKWLFQNYLEVLTLFGLLKKMLMVLINIFIYIFLDQFHAHIVVSFVNATLVLSIGETVEEVTDSGFLGTTQTIGCGLIGDDSLIQVFKCFT